METQLARLTRALEYVRTIDPEMPAQSMLTLLYIAREPGLQQRKLREKLDVVSSTTARIVARLGEWTRYKVPGLNLIATEEDPVDRRQQLLWLTPKGQKFVKTLEEILQG